MKTSSEFFVHTISKEIRKFIALHLKNAKE